MRLYRDFLKPLLDRSLAFVLLLFALPVIAVLALLVRAKMGSPVFFAQKRPGLNEHIFTVYKFRTMTNERDASGELLPDEARLKGIGKFIRSSSLDELPQLFNVLKGDMSFIGPRPLLVEYLPLYSETQKKRHDVLPGITGWAQVNGRNAISWEQKYEYDVWYVEHLSFWLDLKIIFLTILKVLKKEGISQAGNATMEKFMGTKKGENG